MLSISPLLAWFFTLVLLLLAGRATARLALSTTRSPDHRQRSEPRARARGHGLRHGGPARARGAASTAGRERVLPFSSALAAFAAFDWARTVWARSQSRSRSRGRAVDCCASSAGSDRARRASAGPAPRDRRHGDGRDAAAPGNGYSRRDVGHGRDECDVGDDRQRPGHDGPAPPGLCVDRSTRTRRRHDARARRRRGGKSAAAAPGTLLASPATVYACELAMTVLTGLMLLS